MPNFGQIGEVLFHFNLFKYIEFFLQSLSLLVDIKQS